MNNQVKGLEYLKSINSKLENIDYQYIIGIIKEVIQKIPISSAIIKKGAFIYRARINKKCKFPEISKVKEFKDEKDISYISDKKKLVKRIKYGRANKPKESMFYGSLKSSKIKCERITALYEISDLLNDKEAINEEGEIYTVGRWYVKEDFEVAETVFSEEAIKNNPDIKKAFDHHLGLLYDIPNKDFYINQLKFFSNEFAREIKTHNDYKISCAYADIILNNTRILGITYPSVRTEYKSDNIALTTWAVDNYLELKLAGMYKIYKKGGKVVFNNYKDATSLGENNSDFQWVDTNPKYIMPQEDIIKQLYQ